MIAQPCHLLLVPSHYLPPTVQFLLKFSFVSVRFIRTAARMLPWARHDG